MALAMVTACTSGGANAGTEAPTTTTTTSATTTTTATTTSAPTTTVAGPKNMSDLPGFVVVETGTYYVEPIPANSTRVSFTLPEDWMSWAGAYKPNPANEEVYVGLTIMAPSKLIDDPCRSRTWSDPGPTVADLADGLAGLPGMVVIDAPSAVTAFGYEGQHLILEVPDLPFDPARESQGFLDCIDGEFHSYDGRYYQGPRQYLEFWVLDVEGQRLLIEKTHFPASTSAEIAELDSVVASIRIET